MSFNGGTLKVFVNGAWIIWIYLFAIFIRLDYVDAKIGKQFFSIIIITIQLQAVNFN